VIKELPKVKNYAPTENGESPLASIEKWVNTKCPTCKGPAKRETDTMPNWAGSSWYYLRYTDPNNKKTFADAKNLKYWTPVDWYNGGMEHTTLHQFVQVKIKFGRVQMDFQLKALLYREVHRVVIFLVE
jgi:leucyl-tRNA synthetase